MVKFFVASVLCMAAAVSTSARQPQSSPDLVKILEPIRAARNVPALGAILIENGEVVALGVVGTRRQGDQTPATASDRFHLGSCTKAMTSLLLATLVEEGKVSWTTTLGEVLHGVPMHDDWKRVTLHQLVTHRAGAPADLSRDGLWGRLWAHTGTPTDQRATLATGVLKHKPVHAPGTKYLYSNAGYALAGHMAERITGIAWEDLMRQRLFDPLGMTSAGFGAPGQASSPPDQPRGHSADGKPVEPGKGADNPAAIGPGGTVHASLEDWAKIIAVHLRGDKNNPARRERLVGEASFDMLHAPYEGSGERYACGWLVTQRPWAKGVADGASGLALTHAGSNTMWYAVAWIAPERDLAILAVCNQGGDPGARATDEACAAIIKARQAR